MIQIDNTDFLYKTLKKLGVEEDELEKQYLCFAEEGIANSKDFNNNLQAKLGLDFLTEFDEAWFEDVVDYYQDLKLAKPPAKSKVLGLLKQYKQSNDESVRQDIIKSQLKEVLLIACAYKLRNPELNLSDLVQVCNLGLINAVDKFNVDQKLPFDIYLNYWILQAINNEFTKGENNG